MYFLCNKTAIWIGYSKWSFWIYCNFCDIVSAVCSQDWRDIREESAVAVNSCCQDVWRRELSLRYHNGWEFSCFLLQCAFGYCTVLMLAVLTAVSGNLLPHTVIPLDVTTWHGAVDRPRTFCTLQNASQQHCNTSQWQWTASVFTRWHCSGSYSSLFTEG